MSYFSVHHFKIGIKLKFISLEKQIMIWEYSVLEWELNIYLYFVSLF